MFFPMLALPSAQARRAKIRNIGYGVPSDFELSFSRCLPTFGRADNDDTGSSPADRRPGFLNSAPTFDVRQLPIRIFELQRVAYR